MISDGYDLLTLAIKEFDGYYPSKSPTCEPPFVGCGSPHEFCVNAEYVWKSGKRLMCRAPTNFSPIVNEDVCSERVYDLKPVGRGSIKHASNHKTGKSIIPARVTSENRKTRYHARVREWVLSWLAAHATLPGAQGILADRDETVSRQEYDELAQSIFQDFLASPLTNIRSGSTMTSTGVVHAKRH